MSDTDRLIYRDGASEPKEFSGLKPLAEAAGYRFEDVDDKPKTIPTDLGLVLLPAQNGGWIIEQMMESHLKPRTIGAFTNPADMIAALQEAFGLRPTMEETFLKSLDRQKQIDALNRSRVGDTVKNIFVDKGDRK